MGVRSNDIVQLDGLSGLFIEYKAAFIVSRPAVIIAQGEGILEPIGQEALRIVAYQDC